MTRDRRPTATYDEMRAAMGVLGATPPPSPSQRAALRTGRLRGVV